MSSILQCLHIYLYMRELIKQILSETIQRKYHRLTPNQYDKVNKLIKMIFNGLVLEYMGKNETYGDVRVNFCRNGKLVGLFTGGDTSGWDSEEDDNTTITPYTRLGLDPSIFDQIQKVFNIRKSQITQLISDFFEDNYLDQVSSKLGIQFNDMEDVTEYDFENSVCNSVLDVGMPNFQTREEKLDWIESTGRGREYWDKKSDKDLDLTFRQIWRIERENELGIR